MGTIKIPQLYMQSNKDGSVRTYIRVTKLVDGKQRSRYIRVANPDKPNFLAVMEKKREEIGRPPVTREGPAEGTISALIKAFRVTLPYREGKKGEKLSPSSIANWNTYLGQIETDHGPKLVAELTKPHLNKIRNSMMETPAKANAYMSRFKVLLEFARDEGLIEHNPAVGVERMKTGTNLPWPGTVVAEVLEAADYVMKGAIISGLCSGLRISDLIRMRDDWIQPGNPPILMVPPSVKTNTEAYVPMHKDWLAAIAELKAESAKLPVQPITLLHLQNGEPFKSPQELQERLRGIMIKLGHVERDEKGNPLDRDGRTAAQMPKGKKHMPETLYSFHGLSKNAICYLAELDLDDNQIGAIVGKTPQTVRLYSKQKRLLMIAKRSAQKVVAGDFGKLVSGEISIVG